MQDRSADVLDAHAATLLVAGAGGAARDASQLARFLADVAGRKFPPPGRLSARGARTPAEGCNACRDASIRLGALAKELSAAGAENELTNRLTSLAKLLQFAPESENLADALGRLRDEMSPDYFDRKIETFIARLKDTVGTNEFEQVLAELEVSTLKPDHVAAIARAVFGSAKSGISRKKALELIRKPHDARISARRGIAATGGRSAA